MRHTSTTESGAAPDAVRRPEKPKGSKRTFRWYRDLGDEGWLRCPECGFEYNHIRGFGLEYYPQDYGASKDQRRLYFNASFVLHALEVARCASLRIDLECENEHQWFLCFNQSHGCVHLSARSPRLYPEDTSEETGHL
jgi:hypothetical protein